MIQDQRTLCVMCAWRANCAKRFNMGADQTLHCPDFSEDISLRKTVKDDMAAEEKES